MLRIVVGWTGWRAGGCVGQLLHDQPQRDEGETPDAATRDVLIMFGLPADEATEICRWPLRDADELMESS